MTYTEPVFTITIFTRATPRTHLYELRNRRNATILNGNRFMFNRVIRQINRYYKRRQHRRDMDDLMTLLS